MGLARIDLQRIEYYSPNGDITKFEGILIDYYSKQTHPAPYYIMRNKLQLYRPDEPAEKSEKTFLRTVARVWYQPGWTITCVNTGFQEYLSVIIFEQFPRLLRIRFVIFRKQYYSMVEQIANELISKWLSLGFSVLPFDLEYMEEVKDNSIIYGGMREWRVHRANLFKELKDRNPNWSQTKLAINATIIAKERIKKELKNKFPDWRQDQIDEAVLLHFREFYGPGRDAFTEEDVKNDYRAMNWKWFNSRNIS